MRDNIEIIDKVVFHNEVEASKKTVKLPIRLLNIDLESGDAILNCVAFKDQQCKDKFVAEVDQFKSALSLLERDKKDFLSRKAIWDTDVVKGYVPTESTKKAAIEIEKAAYEKSIIDRRKSLLIEQTELNNRQKVLKVPLINRSEGVVGNFKVKISDVSIFDDLVNQITI